MDRLKMMHSRNTLLDEILRFNEKKYYFLIPLLIIGVLGLLLPIIPGLLLLYFVLSIIAPEKANVIVQKIRNMLRLQ